MIGYGIGIPVYAALAWIYAKDGFSVPMVFAIVMAATVPFRPLMVIATAALIILLTRQGGALVERIAAAGRAAFSNYLGTSILMTTLFYGYGGGLFGTMRARRAVAGGGGDVGADAALVETLAGALSLRAVGVALADACAWRRPADAAAASGRLIRGGRIPGCRRRGRKRGGAARADWFPCRTAPSFAGKADAASQPAG